MNTTTLIFLHIPKAAGSTMHYVLERQYPKARTYNIDATDIWSSIEEFKRLPDGEKSRLALLKGHMPFGLHEYLPNAASYITMLRDPVQRIVSHYGYAARNPDHYLHRYIAGEGMDLRTYVGAGISHEMDNGQVRLLSGHDDDVPFGACSPEMLEQAKQNLDKHFSVVGLASRFDESVLLMKEVLGWERQPVYMRKKVSRKNAGGKAVAPDLDAYIREINYLDNELYEYASRLFEQQLNEHAASVARELDRFRRINAIYGSVARFGSALRGLGRRTLAR